jgi:hypothetical protein
MLPNEQEPHVRKWILRDALTGQLRVNFSQGRAAGGVQWIEAAGKSLTRL